MLESAPGFGSLANGCPPLLRRCSRLVGAALFAAILTACGGSDSDERRPDVPAPVDALAAFKQQTLNWQVCAASTMEHEDDQKELAQLGARAQCALMRVPLDYADPSSGELQIELLKVAAAQPAQRLGAIVLNPGGPGEDGLSSALQTSMKLAEDEADETGGLLQQMARQYDLVGFSPRGMGRHSPLNCTLTQELERPTDFNADSSPDNVGKIQRYAQQLAQACAANPLSPHIHTEATARDMDLLRGLLNEEKLNYIGYSYGTWLGAWYAALFPERTGRMLFDSSADITSDFDALMQSQIPASARHIDELLLPRAVSEPARFGLGNDLAALRQRLSALSAPLSAALALHWDFEEIDSDVHAISAALGLQELLASHPQASAAQLRAQIAQSPRFKSPQVAMHADELVASLFSPRTFHAPGKEEFVYWSVRCNDTGTTGSAQDWAQRGRDALQRYPLSEVGIVENPCLYWHQAPRKMPAAALMRTSTPVLMLQSEYDSLTPLEGARKTWEALPDARLIVVEKAHAHGVFPYGTACVDSQVARYFLDGKVPSQSLGSCAGKAPVADDDEDNEEDEDDEDDEA